MSESRHSDQAINKATVIIPCFNVEAYIHECLNSVLLQGASVHHTYVVNNNSTDNTVKNILNWCEANPNFSLTLLSEAKPGAPAARNAPLDRVETKWIQFLDADDLLLPGKIAEQIREFPDADVICAGFQRVSIRGEKTAAHLTRNTPLALIRGTAGITSSNLFSTESIKSVEGWDETLKSSQEYDLMFRVWQTGAAVEVDMTQRALVRERQSGQITHRNPAEKWLQFVELRMQMLHVFEAHHTLNPAELSEAHQVFYLHLLILADHDLKAARDIFFKILHPLGFQPKGAGMRGFVNALLFRTTGFSLSIKIKHQISRCRRMLTNPGSTA